MPASRKDHQPGTTLLEMSIVILVLLTIIGVSMFAGGSIRTWKKGREATEILRAVYTAQRSYLADNPTVPVSSLTPEMLLPYLPNNPDSMPTVETLEGEQLPVRVNVSPPIINNGTEDGYDPSGSRNDSLWDVGE